MGRSHFSSVNSELAGKGKFSELVPYHLLCDVHRDKVLAIMHCKSESDELWRNVGIPCPRFDDFLITRFDTLHHFFEELLIDVGAFFGGARQGELEEDNDEQRSFLAS